MTTHTRTGRPVTQRAAGRYIHRDHTVTGTPAQLNNIVANHRNAGTLVSVTAPHPVPGGRYQAVIRLREYQTTQPTARVAPIGEHTRTRIRVSRRTRIAAIAAAVTGAIAGLVAVAAYLIGQLVELLAAHVGLILGALILAVFLGVAARRRSSAGRHCPGC